MTEPPLVPPGQADPVQSSAFCRTVCKYRIRGNHGASVSVQSIPLTLITRIKAEQKLQIF